MARAIPRQGTAWDERRNTSRVFPVPPGALRAALDALARLRVDDPALVDWIEAGAQNLSDDEHRRRFGAAYTATRSRRRAA